jgi:hypothetical protein
MSMWRRRRARQSPPSLPPFEPNQGYAPASGASPVRGELLFAVPGLETGTLQLDCLVWDDGLKASVPLTISAHLPQDSLAGYLSAMAVDAWCANHEDVSVELWPAGRRPLLALCCRDARVVLALPSD